MALQSSFYNTDGTTRTYPSTKHIATKQHVSVYGKRVSDSTWVILAVDLYELVNNSIVFDTAPDTAIYSQIEVRVADTAIELEDSPSDIAIVAGIAANVSTVAGNTTNINTVATNIGAVQTVSGNTANVTTVATNIANVNTVAGNNSNVTTVAGISGNVTTVAGISANVTTVGTAIANVNTVAGSIANVNTVGASMANVNSVAITVVPNIAEILLADDNAATATAKALEAQHWANYTTDVAVPEGAGEFSAKHYSVKASEYAASVNPSNIMHLTGNESASGVKTFTDGINAPQLVGFKNYIINGNFDVWQRGISQTSSGYGSDDRWQNVNNGSTKTHSRVACTDVERALFNASYFSRTVVNSVAGGIALKMQKIEDVTRLQGKTVTLSFWAKADSNKNIAIEFAQNFGTGGSPSSQVNTIGSQLVALTTTWQKKTITVAIPSIVGKTLGTDGVSTSSTQLAFYYDDGITPSRSANLGQQSGTFDIAQVQIEEGSVATPFEQRPYGLELSLCQRYYEVGHMRMLCSASSLSSFLGDVRNANFSTIKRVTPTMSIFNWYGTFLAVPSLSPSIEGFFATPSVQASADQYGIFNWTASAEL